ncbi:hypothetical protein HA402_006892 [Bradysia odoriphaga]|nr:hypothetical protein HA402_006892 [Bradysia odoriphaga]
MDQDPSPWITNFLNTFGKKVQSEANSESTNTQTEENTIDGTSSQSNYTDDGVRGNLSSPQERQNFRSRAMSSATDTGNVQSKCVEEVVPNLSAICNTDAIYRDSGTSSSGATQSDYPEEGVRRNLSIAPQLLNVSTHTHQGADGMSSYTDTSSAQNSYPEEAVARTTSGNRNVKPKNDDGSNQMDESMKSQPISRSASHQNEGAKAQSNRQQTYRSAASNDQPVNRDSKDDQNQSIRNQNKRGNGCGQSNTNVDDDNNRQRQYSWRSQDNSNRDQGFGRNNGRKNDRQWARGGQGRWNQQLDNNGNSNPVSSNYKSVQNEGQSRNNGQSSGNGNNNRRMENHRTFFGFKKFENYLKMEADPVVLSLHSDIEAFEEFLNESKAYEGNLFDMLLAVLSEKVFSDESNLVSYQNDIVKLLASTDIMNRFRDKCMTLDESKFKFMYNIVDFMKRRMPVSASDCLSGVVSFCIARLGMITNSPECAALLEQFKDLFKSFHEKRQSEEMEAKARQGPVRGKFTVGDLNSFDRLKPPDDFRGISIIPTIEELLSSHSSFLRPNKQSGSYANGEHYLDVQFRLLREDFLQPLKQGIQEYLAMRQKANQPRMPKGSPIRLYYNVKCLTPEVKNENLHYWIQLNSDCKKINWDKSRRLLPGNLVLLTKNSPSFDSVVFATVGSRNDNALKKERKLTIIPESTQSCNFDVLCDDDNLLLIESEVYWESFRHVLKTAQTLNLNAFPLEKYIVRAITDVEPPPALLEPRLVPSQEITLSFEQQRYTVNPLTAQNWPTADMLGLDANQFEAFRAALTKQFVIIQGPPGTGKTYVELPDDAGTFSEYKSPLLCICYTNHALDQFLEGILAIKNKHFMNPNIVRVGGRSKSTILSEFNLRDIDYAISDNDTLNVVYAKQRNAAQIRENDSVERKRLAILTEIFHCLNEKLVKIPDVTTSLDTLKRFNTMDSKNVVDRTLQSVAERYAAKNVIATFVAVIVEEAAEVLEAHIVTSLTKYTDHLILIGDHQQLKPSTAVYDLSKKYDLDVSLFERMVNNNMTCYSLLAQHRMRSEIADLVRGSIYENLNDAPNVHDYEHITGMAKDLFFLTHNKHEKSEGDTLSKSNDFEAHYIAGLAGYLLKQGYTASSITVLTTYTGQMFLLKSQFNLSQSLKPIHITCVDNFQGEENDIILLSLVRSNPEGKMGFLNVSNRVCVALSRAKKGLYIVGNMTMLCKQTLWSEINAKLKKRGQIGTTLTVVCQLHKTQSDIANREDFIKKCPEGGCTEMCGLLMKCSHHCPRFCHSQDLDHENYRCKEPCRKPCLSELAHPCQRHCHFGKVCLPCDVPVHKTRSSCGHDVTVSCYQSSESGYCRAKVKRILKCDHEVTVDCSKEMNGWLCREIVDKILDCGHETKLLCHDDANQYQCKIEVKKKLPCSHYRNMKCFEEPISSMCKTFVDKLLPCGHDQTIECRFDPNEVTCSVKVTVTLDCEHSISVPCFQKTSGKIVCHELCEERLGCGHSCPLKCHYDKDRHHEKFRCKKPCAKACPEGHPCKSNHECSTKCKKCVTVVERTLPVCGHTGKMYCFESLERFKCPEKCTKKLLCGHFCTRKCSETCDIACKQMTTKRTPVCGHDQSVPCSENPAHENCKEKIKIADTLCGHEITVECKLRNAPREQVQSYCSQPCHFKFPEKNGCLHNCSGTCGSCVMGTLHQKCNDKCLRPLICGHLCTFPCSKNCPPCKEKCQMKCEHSKCKKMCGDACFTCKERCSWKCEHKRCTKLCGEMCDRGPCQEPCEKKLRCGHLCIGFCGEICPPLCRHCDSEKLLEFQLLYTEDEDDARFIWLPDCKHAIEVEGLTMHFNATDDSGEIGLKKCPRCTTVITTLSGRFGNVIRKTFAEVAQVKNTFYGNREQNNRLAEEIQHNLQLEDGNLLKYLPSVKILFEKVLFFEEKQNTSVKKLRQVDINTLNSLQQIWIWVKEILKNLLDYTNDTINQDSHALFGNITNRQLPLSAFEVDNIANEIQRLVHKIQFYRRWNSSSNNLYRSDAKELYTKILHILTSKKSYDEKSRQEVIDYTKDLEKILQTGFGISDVERMDIIKALNMKQGHWFKCPNGHLYLIGECGGAMETAKCNECGAVIGGANHALLGTNRFAPEMDGAVRPAYGALLAPQNYGF